MRYFANVCAITVLIVNAGRSSGVLGAYKELLETALTRGGCPVPLKNINSTDRCVTTAFLKIYSDIHWCESRQSSCHICNETILEDFIRRVTLNIDMGEILISTLMARASLPILSLLSHMDDYCTSTNLQTACTSVNCSIGRDFVEADLRKNREHHFDVFLTKLQSRLEVTSKCVSVPYIIKEANVTEDASIIELLEKVSAVAYIHLLNGFRMRDHCAPQVSKAVLNAELYEHIGIENVSAHINEIQFERLLKLLTIGTAPVAQSDTHEHKRRRRSLDDVHIPCLKADDYYRIYGVVSHNALELSQLQEICPGILQQIVSKACLAPSVAATSHSEKYTTAERYGYASLSVFVITLASVVGALVIPLIGSVHYNRVMLVMIGLAVGTLTGDAVMHLIPLALGLHDHAEEGHAHASRTPDYFWKSLCILAAIYAFFILETTFHSLKSKRKSLTLSGHSHTELPGIGHVCQNTNNGITEEINHTYMPEEPQNDRCSSIAEESIENSGGESALKGNRLLAAMVVVGDTLHNFVDGLAIGAAFSVDLASGVATSVAVVCHELPHEFGDFAVLLASGVRVRYALLINFASALSAFVGLYIGLLISVDMNTRRWLFAMTAGMFLYIALADMIPALNHSHSKNKVTALILKHCGILVGFLIMILIAIFENDIKFSQ